MVVQRLLPSHNALENLLLQSWMILAVLMLYQCSIVGGGQAPSTSFLRGYNRSSIIDFTKSEFYSKEMIVPILQSEKKVQESFPWVAGDETRRLDTTQVDFLSFFLSYPSFSRILELSII